MQIDIKKCFLFIIYAITYKSLPIKQKKTAFFRKAVKTIQLYLLKKSKINLVA